MKELRFKAGDYIVLPDGSNRWLSGGIWKIRWTNGMYDSAAQCSYFMSNPEGSEVVYHSAQIDAVARLALPEEIVWYFI